MPKMKFRMRNIIIFLLFAVGFGIMAYPTISDYMASRDHIAAILTYQDTVEKLPADFAKAELKKAHIYNTTVQHPSTDPFGENQVVLDQDYQQMMNVGGVMGRVRIPKIHVDLPVYHGTSEDVLQKGVGHLFGTSLPAGGSGTHATLTAHSGLPSAKLFTDLEKMQEGDRFYIDVLNETLAYEVDQIKVIEPSDIKDLQIIENRDLVTLITCTPYGINSHRLLVRGSRIPLEDAPEREQVIAGNPIGILLENWWIAALMLAILVLLFVVSQRRRKQRRGQ